MKFRVAQPTLSSIINTLEFCLVQNHACTDTVVFDYFCKAVHSTFWVGWLKQPEPRSRTFLEVLHDNMTDELAMRVHSVGLQERAYYDRSLQFNTNSIELQLLRYDGSSVL